MSYENFSYYYDSLMDSKFYDDYLEFIFNHAVFDEVFELACGTGEIAIRLAKAQKQVYASDLSMDMLEVAKQKAMYENVNLYLQRVDMTDFSTDREVDLILCLCDSLNYLLEEKQIIQTFKNVNASLKDNGTFIFDIDSLYKMNHILKDYHEYDEDKDYIFDWQVEYIDNGYVKHHVYIEDKIEDDIVDEYHYQKTFDIHQYLQWLNETGFHKITYYSDFDEYYKDCERIIFVCQKG
ncbi:MAG: class I SAM-dependent methyltransferase [Erysipelotrichaceae bacterium]|nr:class I SAM-dependent methyltransferase [Erysipelotrichaceae bacterium]